MAVLLLHEKSSLFEPHFVSTRVLTSHCFIAVYCKSKHSKSATILPVINLDSVATHRKDRKDIVDTP